MMATIAETIESIARDWFKSRGVTPDSLWCERTVHGYEVGVRYGGEWHAFVVPHRAATKDPSRALTLLSEFLGGVVDRKRRKP